ncbi:nuclear transport factor 2 family protein [Rugamonas rubra]|uniref:Putative lumazine-binding n=1 Tax=Rugamonas rubra TaxID=758825 RepID=A0A1I4TCL8_9BURK|nr:nuclear transport factor 2 family protein [Rugamonas rubra]SFM74307.1 Putative lumazine-binding [Rugamonas rubra]
MHRFLTFFIAALLPFSAFADSPSDRQAVERAVLDYIESQHKADPEMMRRGLDKELAKRTYWQAEDGSEFIMKTDYETMVKVARTYNKDGNKFPPSPRVEIKILDIDNRVASVKLTADEWIDHMHLYKTAGNEWKILNVLWQYHDAKRQVSKPKK